jgi:5-methylthioadenosine/S-adenosylhomocysteine deaminase
MTLPGASPIRRFALAGRIVTMNARDDVIEHGALYVQGNAIVAVQDAKAPPPPGFESIKPVLTGGALYPGLIELHNHLSYNTLRLWDVPRKFDNRAQWARHPAYAQMVTGPMAVIGRAPEHDLVPALVRYVEAKCLVAGVTTSQGIALSSNAGIRTYYKGIVRNVEQPAEKAFPKANTQIPDVDKREWMHFASELERASCFLLHLSEGLDDVARSHFFALKNDDGRWAISPALAGIHCAGLKDVDFPTLAEHGGAMVWSPLSNTLLYGNTARVGDAKRAGVRIGLGSDWSPSGSKSLLGELKVAKLVSDAMGSVFSSKELVAAATREAAAILKWDPVVGSLESGKRADVVVVSASGGAYDELLRAKESDIDLVVIDGVPRFGGTKLMAALGQGGESRKVAGRQRVFSLDDPAGNAVVGKISVSSAHDILEDALRRVPELAKIEAEPKWLAGRPAPRWTLALDEQMHDPWLGPGSPASLEPETVAALPLLPLELDPLTVADDASFFDRLRAVVTMADDDKQALCKALERMH